MRTQVMIVSLLAALGALPAHAVPQSYGPARDDVSACKTTEDSFTVGQCLAFARENGTNEYAAACTAFSHLLPFVTETGEVLRNVGDCIAYLSAIEGE